MQRPELPQVRLNILLTALFAREGSTYARLWNASGEPTDASLAGRMAVGAEVSLRLDENAGGWPRLRPWGIHTLRLDNGAESV
jgi:hypothetical protein